MQQPMYFINHLLKDAEERCTKLKKLALTLILTTRRLYRYFLSHPLTVLTNSTLGHVLANLEALGRLIKWTIKLSEYDIHYQQRTTIKAQTLADFLADSATCQGSEVGILLVAL